MTGSQINMNVVHPPSEGREGAQNVSLLPREVVATKVAKDGHLPSLDGVRGIAILLVLLVHFYQKPLVGEHSALGLIVGRIAGAGRYGVELFFVLSGFLITGILLRTRGQRGTFTKFYARRFLRIFPLYYGALAVVLFVLPHFVAFDDGAQKIISGQFWLWTYLANFPRVDYVWDDSNIFLLGHFWSLCVEEHFYIVWPLLVLLLPERILIGACGFLVGTGIFSRAMVAFFGAGATSLWSWSTLQRLDGLAVGACIAIALNSPSLLPYVPRDAMLRRGLVVLSVITGVIVMLPRQWYVPAVYVFSELFVVLFFGVILLLTLAAAPTHLWSRALSSKPLIAFGKYSYGIYVIHGILRPWLEKTFITPGLTAGSAGALFQLALYYAIAGFLSFALAYVCFHLYERPWLLMKRFFEYSKKASLPVPSVRS